MSVLNLITQVSESPSHRGPRIKGILGIGGSTSEEGRYCSMLKPRFLYLIKPSCRRVDRPWEDQLSSDRWFSTVASGNRQ